FDGTRLNFCDTQCNLDNRDPAFDDGYAFTAPVGSYPDGVSWVGAMDMSGNVWEWTNTLYNQLIYPYPYATDDGRERADQTEGQRVRRGGSWDYEGLAARAPNRLPSDPQSTAGDAGVIGFRCVADYTEAVEVP
ncbi:MAG TPA: SUMF1/EgtB/PvdO family nonheme iron enzyme, partial [Phototrophicaceae bacterium]|nr:SUMF1/EgtB/PvdO family nonheme iron enzyme [Phototrophicaceae bacterium]